MHISSRSIYNKMTHEEREKIRYMLSAHIPPNIISVYMGYKRRMLNKMIPKYFRKAPKPRVQPKQEEIDEVLRLRKVLESGIDTQYQLRKIFQNSILSYSRIYKIVEVWGYKLKRRYIPPKKQRYFRIKHEDYIKEHKLRNGEDKAVKYFTEQGYIVYVLKNMGADLFIEKDNKRIIVEVKNRIGQNGSDGIVQLLYAKKMIRDHLNIFVTGMMIFSIKKPNNNKNTLRKLASYKRYMDAFNIRLHFCPELP